MLVCHTLFSCNKHRRPVKVKVKWKTICGPQILTRYVLQLIFKKTEDSSGYKDLAPDPEFHRMVFNETDYSHARSACDMKKGSEENSTKLGKICVRLCAC